VKGRRILVLAAPGDRRDQDIIDVGHAAAGKFDLYVCRRDDNRRGRAADEVPLMLKRALLEQGVDASRIVVVPDEVEAVDYALGAAREGDLVLVFADALTRSWKQILHFVPEVDRETPRVSTASASHATPEAAASLEADIGDSAHIAGAVPSFDEELLVRDERGVRLARESDD
jgi:cyanophycin synthetase